MYKMSQKQIAALKRQMQNLEREIRKERENIKQCEEDFKATKDDSQKLQLNTQRASHEASVRVLEEDFNETAEILKGLLERETEMEDLRREMEEDMRRKFEDMRMGERQAEGGAKDTSDMEKMIGGLMKFASTLEGAANRMERDSRTGGWAGDPRSGGGTTRKTLGSLPSFTAGSSDFILHLRSFKDYVSINEITDNGKIKRLFLNTFDQVSRMRCSGIDPSFAPHNTSTLAEFYDAVKDLFIPRSEMQILRQAFYEHRQGPRALAMDFMMEKWSKFKRAWDRAPFSFFFENCTNGLSNEELRQEVFRKVIDCDNPADEVAMSAAFSEYVQHVQESIAYVRRVMRQGNPDHLGLAVVAQSNDSASVNFKTGVREMSQPESEGSLEQMLGSQGDEDDEEYELTEEQVALCESLEDPFFTDMIENDPAALEEYGEKKRCFICNSEFHLARRCGQRLEMRKPFLRRTMGNFRGGGRGRAQRGNWRPRGGLGRGRQPPLNIRYSAPQDSLASQARPVTESAKKPF